ncbi:MAG: NAD(P)H-hydrate dehydratase [Methanosarcinaceae archaeon]|nr:NAD(P)H-hydrate dehydratase [Methanosarcinaceae archaeon]
MRAITSSQMKAIDANCKYLGLLPLQLMENAGSAIAWEIMKRFERVSVLFVAGRGNNGGDAFVAARHLASISDFEIRVIILGQSSKIKTEESRRNFRILKHSDVEIKEIADTSELLECDWFNCADIIVDAILGTGIKGSIREPESTAIDLLNSSSAYVIAVDIPSGFDPDGGVADKSVRANLTLTFHRMKSGLTLHDAKTYAGEIKVIDIGVCEDAEKFVGMGNIQMLKRRRIDSHKGHSGRVLIIGGGAYSGAPALAALAALRTGADIVTVAAPKSVAGTVASFSPNLIVRSLSSGFLCPDDLPQLSGLIGSHDVVVIGMGIGRSEETRAAVAEILPLCRKVVVDADAFYGLVLPPADGCEIIITPHAGEFAQIRGRETPAEMDERADVVLKFSVENHVVTLLKGPVDVISDGKKVQFNRTGNAGMTVGGTGDVLAGIVGALFAVNQAMDAASCSAFINGAAGELAFGEHGFGLLATDVIDRITEVMK